MHKRIIWAVLSALLVAALAPCALAVDLDADEVHLADTATVEGQSLVLNGTALRVAYGLVDVYVAGLYLDHKTTSDTDALAMEGNKYMTMTFVRDVDTEDICDAWVEGMEDNLPEAEAQALKPRLDQLCAASPDIEEGSVMAYAYDAADDSTSFYLDDVLKVKIPGKDFYQGLLACWIGPDPGPGDDFKEDLLGLDD